MTDFAGNQYIIEIVYLLASALFILSLKWMSSPSKENPFVRYMKKRAKSHPSC